MKKSKHGITFKAIFGSILLLVLFAVIVSIVGYRAFTGAMLEQYSEGAFHIADTAALMIDADLLDTYLDGYYETGSPSKDYLETWSRLDDLCNASGATFIYVIRPDLKDYNHIYFLFSTVNSSSSYYPYEIGYVRTTTNDEYKVKYQNLYTGESVRELLLLEDRSYDQSVHHITAMIPLTRTTGETSAILCVQRQMSGISSVRREFVQNVMWVLLALIVLVIIGNWVYLHQVLIKPIQKITGEASRFADESHPAERKLVEEIRNRDEIGILADSIDRMEEQVMQYIDNLTHATAEKERMAAELSLASRIQEAMLPHIFPPFPDRNEFELYAIMDPAREVGGDFYDFFLIDPDHLCLVIADVSGKGIPAALFMMNCKTILKSCAMLGRSAADILANTNASVCVNNQEDMFVTAWIGILEISTGKMIAASAGHEYPALRRASGSFEILKDRHGLPLGAIEGAAYSEYELQFHPGDAIFVYTDGVPEAINTEDQQFGTGWMLAALNRAPDASPEKLLRNVREDMNSFVGNAEQFDDITMLCFTFKG